MFGLKSILFVFSLIAFVLPGCKEDDNNNNPVTPPVTTVTDIDGNVYHIVKIDTQTWMLENLQVTKFNDGTPIPLVTDDSVWSLLSTPGYCLYKNDAGTYKSAYGGLYNWYAVNSGKLAPSGWHVPTDSEWTMLVSYLGGDSLAGGKLKEAGLTHWASPNEGATNSSGFTALPGSFRFYSSGTFGAPGSEGMWWTSTGYKEKFAWARYMYRDSPRAFRTYTYKNMGLSVRCVKD
jgi:uncharacterized protein (TIGR02145 family)